MPSVILSLQQLPLAPTVEVLCCHYAVLQTWSYPDLAAPYWRWYWVDRPGAFIRLGLNRFDLVPGQVVLIPPNTHFSAHNHNVIGFLYLHFLVESNYHSPFPEVIILPLAPDQEQFIRQFAARFPDLAREESSPLLSLPQALISLALQRTERSRWAHGFKDARVLAAIQHIQARYPAAVPNLELARRAGMHLNAFIRTFKKVTAQTPHQFLQTLRLTAASSLLHHSQLSLESVAEKTGFNDRQHLNLTFKKSFRITPAQFRKNALAF